MSDLLTDREVARHFGMHWQSVQLKCKAREWPHIKVGRYYKFTPADLEQIERLLHVDPVVTEEPADSWGLKTRGAR